MDYKYPLKHPDKLFIFFYSPSIHTSILKAFTIQKQEQTFLFLEFKSLSFIYYNFHLKLLTLSLDGLQIPSKNTNLQVLWILPLIIQFLSYKEENININIWLITIQTLNIDFIIRVSSNPIEKYYFANTRNFTINYAIPKLQRKDY
jgi:hypothetical protein